MKNRRKSCRCFCCFPKKGNSFRYNLFTEINFSFSFMFNLKSMFIFLLKFSIEFGWGEYLKRENYWLDYWFSPPTHIWFVLLMAMLVNFFKQLVEEGKILLSKWKAASWKDFHVLGAKRILIMDGYKCYKCLDRAQRTNIKFFLWIGRFLKSRELILKLKFEFSVPFCVKT